MPDDTLGGRLMHARQAKGLSHGELASRIGVMTKTVGNWEADRSEPRGNKLVTVAGVLGVPMLWLATGEEMYAEGQGAEPAGETDHLMRKVERLAVLQREISRLVSEISREVRRRQGKSDTP